jgi:hypothetical protein
LDAALRPYAALIAVPIAKDSPLAEPTFDIYKAQLMENGRVEHIGDLIKAAREAGVLEDVESPIPRWTDDPSRGTMR